jgi:uncharacterized membrane protein YfcA
MDQFALLLPTVLACAAALLVAGVVKGVISIGLPLVGLPLLMLVLDVPDAVSLLMLPLLLSNLLQAVEGEGTIPVLRRFWPLLLCLAVGTLIGTTVFATFARLDQRVLLLSIGPLCMLFATASLLQPNLKIHPGAERWLGPPVGLAAGVIGGMSTLFGPVLSVYVIGLHLSREMFIKSISLLYVAAAGFLLLGGAANGSTGPGPLLLSLLAMLPVYAGMLIGQRIRHRIDPRLFRLLVLGVVWLTGANMIRTGLGY